MQEFRVTGMSCEHCERAVTAAVHGVDASAAVAIDLAAGTVRTGSAVPAARLAAAIEAAGYQVQQQAG